jgi:hypothetical protein
MKSGLMLGVNPNAEREENDYYATNPHALEIALPTLQSIGLDKNVWECSCGGGHLSEELIKNGYKVYSSDLIDRGYGQVKDFLECSDKWDGDILTNPPFKLAEDFIKKSMELLHNGHKAIFFLKVQFLESQKRKQLFEKYPPKYVIVNSERQQCAKNAEFDKYTATTQFYCWFIFEKGYNGITQILWI